MNIIIRENWPSLLMILFHRKFIICIISIIIPLKSYESIHYSWAIYTKNKGYNQFMVLSLSTWIESKTFIKLLLQISMIHASYRNIIINYFIDLSYLNHNIIMVYKRSQQNTAYGIKSSISPDVENKVILEHSHICLFTYSL